MRVLLTRAAEDAAGTRAALEALGHQVILSPVIAIEPIPAVWPGGVVDAVLATSAHAFGVVASDWGPTSEARRLMPLRLVGARTEGAARACGFLGAATVRANAVALAMEMAKKGADGRAVYLAGCDRKPDLETSLGVMGQRVETVEVYRASALETLAPAAAQALQNGSIDAALHYSRRSAETFLRAAGEARPPPLNICLSDDVARPLVDAGWRTQIAEGPQEASLLAALAK